MTPALLRAYESGDSLKIARATRPDCKLILVVDERTRGNLGMRFCMAVAPDTPWFDLLPDTQKITITDDGPHKEPLPS